MLIWDDSLLFLTRIVKKNRIDLLNTVNCIVFPWTITSLQSFFSVWLLQQTHKRQWFYIILQQNFHQSWSHGISEFCFPTFFGKFWFLIKRMQCDFLTHINLSIYIYTYILFWASFEKFEWRTMWVDWYCSFRKTWSNFIKKMVYMAWCCIFQYI